MPHYSDMLLYLRKRAQLTQQELADRTGLSRSAIGMYETGRREPDLETFEIFADFYNVDMNTLTGRALSPQRETPALECAEVIPGFDDLTAENQVKALEYIELLLNAQRNG